MVNYFIYARDCSFSTFNNEYFHSNGLKTLEQFKRDVENIKNEQMVAGQPPEQSKIIYLQWGNDCWEVDENGMRTSYLKRQCEPMGSEPEWIVRYLQENYIIDDNDKIKLLYIITDGLISIEGAEKCYRLNEFMNYEMLVFHAFNEDPEKIDLSIAACFFKSRCLVYRNNELYASTDICKEFNYDRINAYNFASEIDQLKIYIMLKFVDQFKRDAVASEEINKLKKLRDRLFEELSSETKKTKPNQGTECRNGFHKDVETDWNLNLIPAVEMVMKVDIDKTISALIKYILSDKRTYAFDGLAIDAEFDESVEEDEIDDLDFNEEVEIFDFILEEEEDFINNRNRRLLDAT